MSASDTIIETKGLSKSFKGFWAVRNVDLKVKRGTIHALIGPNGAGKTTCFNLITKFLQPTSGTILFNGRDITATKPADVARLGLVRSFQISATFPHLSLIENVRVALQRPMGNSFQFWRSERCLDVLNDRALELLDEVGLKDSAHLTAVELSYGRKRALEIATTLALEPEMLLLDEPMAGMGSEDIFRIAALIKRVAASRTVLMVEHNLNVVANLSDTITVLARGEILAEGPYAEVSRNPQVIEAYMGTGGGIERLFLSRLYQLDHLYGLAALLVSAVMGFIVGLIAIRRQGIYFAMVTLALAQMVYFLCVKAPFTGGEDGIQGVPRRHALFGLVDTANDLTLYYLVLAVFAAGFLVIHRTIHSPFGQVLKAIRENEPRAISLGYRVDQYKLLALVISAALAGLAGASKSLVFPASLTDAQWQMSGEVVLMTLVGGMGTVFGPSAGAAIIVTMQNYLKGLGEWVLVIQGAIFVVTVLLFRRGVVGEIMALAKRARARG